jgi:hypothetical protein
VVRRGITLGGIVLGTCGLALDSHDEVVITATLVVLLLLEPRGGPIVFVHDLLALALRGVQGRRYRFLTVCVVGRDLEELPSGSGSPTPQTMDEGGAGGTVLERRNGVVVGRAEELGASFGEASDVVMQALT